MILPNGKINLQGNYPGTQGCFCQNTIFSMRKEWLRDPCETQQHQKDCTTPNIWTESKLFRRNERCPICPSQPPPPPLLSVFNKAVPTFVTTVMMADGSHWFRAPHLIKGMRTKVSQAQSVLAKIPSVKGYSVKAATEHIEYVRHTSTEWAPPK